MKDLCPASSFIHRVQRSGVSTALMTACNCSITHTNVHSGPLFPAKKMHFHCGPGCQPRPVAWSLSDAGTERTMSYSWEETWAVLLITTAQSWMESSVPTAMKGPVIRLFLLIDCLLYFNTGLFFIDLASSFSLMPRQIYCRDSGGIRRGQVFSLPSPRQPLSSISGRFCFLRFKDTLNTLKVRTNKVWQIQ